MKKTKFVLISIAFAGLAGMASAQQNFQEGPGDRFFPALGRLLTGEQRQSLRKIIESERGQIQPLEEKIRLSRQGLLREIASGKFDENAARPYAEQSASAEEALTLIFAKALSQMQPALSERQMEQLKNCQPGRFQQFQDQRGPEPESHLKLPPSLPRDTNDLPVVK